MRMEVLILCGLDNAHHSLLIRQVLLKLLIDHGSDLNANGADQLTCEQMLLARHHQVLHPWTGEACSLWLREENSHVSSLPSLGVCAFLEDHRLPHLPLSPSTLRH